MKHAMMILVALGLTACGTVDTGNVGVRKTYGTVNTSEEQPGFYVAILSSVNEYTTKETEVPLNDLTPKARDNLSLDDLDVSVYYIAAPSSIAELTIKYAGQDTYADGIYYPAFNLVERVARSVAYGEVAKYESLTIHTQREALEQALKAQLQKELDSGDKGVFTITRVVIRAVATDTSIEKSIQAAVQNQKLLEAKKVEEQIAEAQARILVKEAEGISRANNIINGSLTREYLQHEANLALMEFARKGGTTTVVVPANMPVTALLPVSKQP